MDINMDMENRRILDKHDSTDGHSTLNIELKLNDKLFSEALDQTYRIIFV